MTSGSGAVDVTVKSCCKVFDFPFLNQTTSSTEGLQFSLECCSIAKALDESRLMILLLYAGGACKLELKGSSSADRLASLFFGGFGLVASSENGS